MKILIQSHASVSAAGSTKAAARKTYATGQPSWVPDDETGLPVYRVNELPTNEKISAFTTERDVDRTTLLALHAANQAVAEAGWQDQDFSILVGCSRGPTGKWEEAFAEFAETGKAGPKTSPSTTLGSIGFALADYFGSSALASSLSVTCSSGMHAILHGVALLKAGMAKRVLVGGAEAPLTTFTLRQMEALRIYAPVPGAGEHACRPLSTPASGMVVGEGAAFLALSLEPAEGKLAIQKIAYGRERAVSLTGISAEGAALHHCMRQLMDGAGPDFIVAHAPGTRRGDQAEVAAVQALYADCPEDPVMTSFKWATGHTFGASGPLAVCGALDMMAAGSWWPRPYGPAAGTPWALGQCLVNATGFGGNGVSVMLGK